MSLEGKSTDEVAALAALSDSLLQNPALAGQFKRLLKTANPKLSMPDIELEDRTTAALKKSNEKIAELEGKLTATENKVEGRLTVTEAEKSANALYENLKEAGIVGKREEFSALVTWASANGFMTSETGLRKAAQQRTFELEAAEPTPTSVGGAILPKDNKDLMKDPTGWARAQAAAAMDELRAKRGRTAH